MRYYTGSNQSTFPTCAVRSAGSYIHYLQNALKIFGHKVWYIWCMYYCWYMCFSLFVMNIYLRPSGKSLINIRLYINNLTPICAHLKNATFNTSWIDTLSFYCQESEMSANGSWFVVNCGWSWLWCGWKVFHTQTHDGQCGIHSQMDYVSFGFDEICNLSM